MSAPAIERRPGTVREAGTRRSGVTAPPRIPAQRVPERAAERATQRERSAAAGRRDRAHAGRAKFVLVVMTLLVCGLVATLWLSTAAAADSYRLQEARTRAGSLTEQSEQLRKQVTAMNAPGALAERAEAQGLVPVQDPARLVVAPDGRVDVVGEPTAARGAAPEPAAPAAPPATPVDPAAAQQPAAQATPAQPAGQPAGAQPAAAQPAAPDSQAQGGVPAADTSDPAAADGATRAGGNG